MGYINKLLGNNEQIIMIKRRHWLVWRPALILSIVAAIALLAGAILLAFWLLPQYNVDVWVRFVPFAALLLPALWFLPTWMRWRNEQYIVTNRRILQVEGIFNKHTLDSSLDKINDVMLTQTVFGRMFGYGNLEILTGSGEGMNKLENIQDPLKFKKAMLDAKEALRGVIPHEGAAQQPVPEPERVSLTDSLQELTDAFNKGLITADEYNAKRKRLIENA